MFQNITNRTKKRNTNSKQNDEYQRLNEFGKWCVSVDVLHDFHEKIKKNQIDAELLANKL